jgi:hypothetical protein
MERKSRPVYLATPRVYVASIAAQVCAACLFVGVLGAVFTWNHHSALFDLANSPNGISKPQLGYLFGPALILIALPLVRHRPPRVAYTSHYRARIAFAILLWVAGLTRLLTHLTGLDSEYTLQAGAYVATALMAGGLLGTLAMWPSGLRSAQFDRRGGVEAVPAPVEPG